MNKIFKIYIVFTCLFLLISCSKEPKSYYPLSKGKTWEYQIFYEGISINGVVTNLESRELKGRKVIPQRMDIGGVTSFSFVSEDEHGIYEFATQKPGSVEPEVNKIPNYYIKYPIKVGTSWIYETKTSLLSEKVPITLEFNIESIDEDVTVPAGTFQKCIKVKGVGKTKKNYGFMFGTVKFYVENYNWYASGVGLIKSILRERSDNWMIGNKELTMQLLSFKK